MPGTVFAGSTQPAPQPSDLDGFVRRLMGQPGLHPQRISKIASAVARFNKHRGLPSYDEALKNLHVEMNDFLTRTGGNPALVQEWMVVAKSLEGKGFKFR